MTSTPHSHPISPDAAEAQADLLINTTDAEVWAKEWIRTASFIVAKGGGVTDLLDEAWMLSWFANAIETGRNFGRKELCPHTDTFTVADDLQCCRDCGFLIQPVTLEESFVEGFQEGRQ